MCWKGESDTEKGKNRSCFMFHSAGYVWLVASGYVVIFKDDKYKISPLWKQA